MKKEAGIPVDNHLVALIESGDLSPSSDVFGRQLGAQDIEAYDFMLRKAQEAVEDYFNGGITYEEVVRHEPG